MQEKLKKTTHTQEKRLFFITSHRVKNLEMLKQIALMLQVKSNTMTSE